MHEADHIRWHNPSSRHHPVRNGLGDLLKRPGGEEHLRASVEPHLGMDAGAGLDRDALVQTAISMFDDFQLTVQSNDWRSVAVDPRHPVGGGSEDLGNLIDLLGDEIDRTEEDDADEDRPTWIEIAVVDEQGLPIRGRQYHLTLPDGTVRSGQLGAQGIIRFDDVDPGECTLELLDQPVEDEMPLAA